jgi:hypothetical protein
MKQKLIKEDEEFDPERYAYDNYDDEELVNIECLISTPIPKPTT